LRLAAKVDAAVATVVDAGFGSEVKVLVIVAFGVEMPHISAADQQAVLRLPAGLVLGQRLPAGQVLAVEQLYHPRSALSRRRSIWECWFPGQDLERVQEQLRVCRVNEVPSAPSIQLAQTVVNQVFP